MSPGHIPPTPLRGGFFLALLTAAIVVGVLIYSCNRDAEASHNDTTPCIADLVVNGKVDIADISSFTAPIRRLDTSPGDANFDARWDLVPGPMTEGGNWINVQDLSNAIIHQGWCETDVQFYSKITTDHTSDPAILNNYDMIHHWECCQQYPNNFSAGPALTYVDYFVRNGEAPYVPFADSGDILRGTNGAQCNQSGMEWDNRYQMDIRDPGTRALIVDEMARLLDETATDGIMIDVAEAHLPNAVSNCAIDAAMTASWLDGWADFTEELTLLPGPLAVNFQPSRWDNVQATSALDAQRLFRAVDIFEVEHGWVLPSSDAGSLSGWNDLIAKIDYAHQNGAGVFLWEYGPGYNQCESLMSPSQELYSLAMWFIMRDAADFYGTFSRDGRCGDAFSSLYHKDLGQPTGSRVSCGSGCLQRNYAGGTVTANFNTKTGTLP